MKVKGNKLTPEVKNIVPTTSKKETDVKNQVVHLLGEYQEQSRKNQSNMIQKLPVDKIIPDPHQARDTIDERKIEELANSIAKQGLLQPIRVKPEGDKYQIIFGERRWRAVIKLGLTEIDATIEVDATEEKTILQGLIENLQRVDLTEVQKARQIIKYKNMYPSISYVEIGENIGYSKARIVQFMRLTKLSEKALLILEDMQGLTERHFRAITILNDIDESFVLQLINEIKDKSLSGEESIARAKQMIRSKSVKKSNISSVLSRLHTRLDKLEKEWPNTSPRKQELYRTELLSLVRRINILLNDENITS